MAFPLAMVAVMITAPAAVVVRVFPLIVAPVVPGDFIDHMMVLSVALDGLTVPERARVPTEAVVGTPVIPVTATKVLEAPPGFFGDNSPSGDLVPPLSRGIGLLIDTIMLTLTVTVNVLPTLLLRLYDVLLELATVPVLDPKVVPFSFIMLRT